MATCTHARRTVTSWNAYKLEFHWTDTDTVSDTDILADFRARKSACRGTRVHLVTSRTRTTILADLSADLYDTRAFPREDPREDVC